MLRSRFGDGSWGICWRRRRSECSIRVVPHNCSFTQWQRVSCLKVLTKSRGKGRENFVSRVYTSYVIHHDTQLQVTTRRNTRTTKITQLKSRDIVFQYRPLLILPVVLYCYVKLGLLDLRKKAEREWRTLYSEELHNLCSSPSTVRVTKLKIIRCVRHIACRWEMINAYTIWAWKTWWETSAQMRCTLKCVLNK